MWDAQEQGGSQNVGPVREEGQYEAADIRFMTRNVTGVIKHQRCEGVRMYYVCMI
jgi:hypothetical protein